MSNYLRDIFKKSKTPQSEPIPGSAQVPNSAGGYSFAVDDITRLRRFLILGAEGGSYYASERALTKENAEAVLRLIKADGPRVVREIMEISDSGRAPKNDPALFALALCAAADEAPTRAAALAALPKVARIGTHLFHFAEYVNSLRGWGRGLRAAFGNWYTGMDAGKLALQAVKYQQRDGWSHADLLRLSHPKAEEPHNTLFKYMVDGWPEVGDTPHPVPALQIVWAHERAKVAGESEIVDLIRTYNLPMESIPTDKRTKAVYEALIPASGITWLLRNVGNLAKVGAVAEGQYSALNTVVDRLTDAQQIRKGRVHPLSVLTALKTYQSGRGVRGESTWPVIEKLVDALDSAFYLAFQSIEPTGARLLLGLDVSISMMSGNIAGMPGITPRVGSAAMAMIAKAIEPNTVTMAFCDRFVPFEMPAKKRLDAVCEAMDQLSFGGTDCALPMIWATENRVEADAFVVYTDSETWAGQIHPTEALRAYRNKMGIAARLIVVGMVASKFTIADPEDAGMLDVVGFDSSAPGVISEFAAGRL